MRIFLNISLNMHGFVVFLLLFSSICTTAPFGYSKGLNGFILELVHHDSPLSPFYNASISITDLITNAVLRSISRVSSSLLSNENESSPKTIIIPNRGDYLMRIYIGTPPVERLAIADTGSDLIWVQCSPCLNCFHQDTPLYNKTMSSTFTNVSCQSQPCTQLPPNQQYCGPSKECLYSYKYGDQSFSVGELITDSINFGSNNTAFLKSITFGCGYYNKFTNDASGRSTGLVGLGAGPLSLVSQLGDSIGHKFSYCLVPFNSNTNSKIKFGSEATISGNGVVSTPLIVKSPIPYYFLNLEGVTIGQKRVETSDGGGNIIIDSGTTLTLLEENFYNDFVASVKEAIGVETEEAHPPFSFCFNAEADQVSFPDFVFHFTGADVTLKPINLFVTLDNNLICLLVAPLNAGSLSIFGNTAQVNFQVEYDLEGKTVSFAPTDCTNN